MTFNANLKKHRVQIIVVLYVNLSPSRRETRKAKIQPRVFHAKAAKLKGSQRKEKRSKKVKK